MSQNAPEHSDAPRRPVFRTTRARFAEKGYVPEPPEELTDTQLPGRLWELIYAAAACGLYFKRTDHLSDRQLYTLLWGQWLDELYPEFENCRQEHEVTLLSDYDAGGMTSAEIQSLYYPNTPEELGEAEECSNNKRNRSGVPGYDRDQFLPIPPIPLEAHAGWLPGDPVETVEEQIEAEEDEFAEEDAEEAWKDSGEDAEERDEEHESFYDSGDPLQSFDNPGDEDDEEDGDEEEEDDDEGDEAEDLAANDPELMKHLEEMEPENWVSPAQTLIKENVPLLPPSEITDETLGSILWELLHNLALQGFYILHSDHLSERELYAELWHHGLREPAHLPGRSLRGGWFHDFLGSWSEEDMQLWLKYYATEEERAHHASEYPEDNIPDHVDPCSRRDWRLPQGPF